MKVKELLKTVNVAWSPPAQHPVLLAAGTAAQQLDASFNTSASLDLYSLNLQQPGYDMELKASVSSDHRFHKIIWGSYGNNPAGIIVGGCDYGTIKIYSASKLLSNDSSCLLSSPDRHTGPVRAMDFNPFQGNLLASGATESEIYIWDIVNTNAPMTPGSKSQPQDDVQHIAWNKQVQHILASTFSQRCVIWDLRKNEPIIKLTDANSKVRWKVVQWHPDVATQLCLASEDDQAPFVELWDLRFATSPLKTLQNHQRGVLSIAWNTHDPDLLLSCAKDNRILCWNPNSDAPNGEVICELAQTNQWNFDVSWCPRNPGLVVGTSFDGHAVVYSLLGGHQQQATETSNKIVDSFPGMDPFTQAPPAVQSESAPVLTKAPKWLKRPFGASFGFGGKLIIFENESADPNVSTSPCRKVIISQVVTQPDVVRRSEELEETLKTERYLDYCIKKAEMAADEHGKKIWNCVAAYFGESLTKDVLRLLDYNVDAMNEKLSQFVVEEEISTITEGVDNLNNVVNGNVVDGTAAFDAIAAQEQFNKSNEAKQEQSTFRINTSDDEDGLISQAILLGNIEAAVSLCFAGKRYADAVILSMAAGPDLLARTQYRYFSERTGALNSLINSLVSENWAELVKNSDISCWREVLLGIFTHASAQERPVLCDILGDRLASCDDVLLRRQSQICYVCSGNLSKIIGSSEGEIQEVVELVTLMRRALELHGVGEQQAEGKIATILTRYAEILAAEGNLESALSYLGESQDQQLGTLKERLCRALGYIQDAPRSKVTPVQNYNGRPSQNVRTGFNPAQNVQTGFNPAQSGFNPAQGLQPGFNSAQNIQSGYNTAQNLHAGFNTAQNLQTGFSSGQNLQTGFNATQQSGFNSPQSMQSGFNPSQSMQSGFNATQNIHSGPNPPQNLQSGFSPAQMNSSAVQKPVQTWNVAPTKQSLGSGPLGQFGTAQAYPGSYDQYQHQTPPPPLPGSASATVGSRPPSVGPQARSKYLIDPSVKSSPTYNPSFNQYGTQQVPSYQVPPPNLYEPQNYGGKESKGYKPTLQGPTQVYNPIRSQPTAQGYGAESSYQPPMQPSGWNDPPIGKSSRLQPKNEFQTQNPILHPLRSGPQQAETNDSVYPDQQVPYGVQQYGQGLQNPGLQYEKPVEPLGMVEPEERPKLPIPEQHLHLKTVFDELRSQCYENANNPQTKRKIEDVSRKLETLYDCLRENKLSQNTLQGLHQISQMIQTGNYTGGLDLHTQLVSGPDFSQISSFMPGIKVLLLSALQLNVYIR
ncbi:hypothetical protein KM043_004690 [Ampulex compressa]|nr:hypothetical protein KM043_004690 [Ampulex compressa]